MKQGQTVNITAWKGINNVKSPDKVGHNTLVAGKNIVIDQRRRVLRRRGKTIRLSGVIHSVWSNLEGTICLCVRNNDLVRVARDWTATTLLSSIGTAPVAFLEVNGVVYYSNGSVTGCVDRDGSHRTWGLTTPAAPSLSALAGAMQAGTYQVLCTFIRSDGQESGSGRSAVIELTAGAAVDMVLPVSTDPTVEFTAVYGTEPDGTVFRLIGYVSASTTAFTWNGELTGAECPTMNMGPPPAGTILALHNNVVLIGSGDTIWDTQPYSPELVDLSHGYKQFDGQVAIIGPVDSGVYLSWGERIAFAGGDDWRAASLKYLADYGSIPGTLVYFDDEIDDPNVRPQVIERSVMWMSHQGIVRGGPGGVYGNMTAGVYQNAITRRGAGFAYQRDGEYRYIASLQGTDTGDNVYQDTADVDTSHYVGIDATFNGLGVTANI